MESFLVRSWSDLALFDISIVDISTLLKYTDIDKISSRLEFGISNRASSECV